MPYLDAANRQLPFQSGSTTSRDAAVAADAFLCEQAEVVLTWIRQRTSGTQKDAASETGISRQSLAARFNELEHAQLIAKTDERRDRCAVYVVRVPSTQAA
jgi:DNA-binding MarR family transcriptional regulator